MLQKLRGKKGSQGFTLIELMIVVAIIGILAAIAIPNFLTYQKKSKSSEAKTCIGGIKTSQIAFQTERDRFAACAPVTGAPTSTKQVWPGGGGFDSIGWSPAGDVYYQYQVDVANNGNGVVDGCMVASAASDLDDDGANGEFVFATEFGTLATTTGIAGSASADSQLQDVAPGSY
jgi:type IV pilus assembly protein PilA